MYIFFHPLLAFTCPLLSMMLVNAFDDNNTQLKTAFGLSIGSIFLMLAIIFYLCYKNLQNYRNRNEEDLVPLEP